MTSLTPAELRVLEAMRTADNERDAARKLGLSPWTVAAHLRSVRAKCGVRTTRQALAVHGVGLQAEEVVG